jgi:hypothetical protein
MIEGVLPLTIDQQSSIFSAKKKKKKKKNKVPCYPKFLPSRIGHQAHDVPQLHSLRVELHVGLTITLFVVKGVTTH